jgi:hypothetical protein
MRVGEVAEVHEGCDPAAVLLLAGQAVVGDCCVLDQA